MSSKASEIDNSYIVSIYNFIEKYRGKSWIEICWEEEEEEEKLRLEEEAEERRRREDKEYAAYMKMVEERRYLYSIGKYELEEGEILE